MCYVCYTIYKFKANNIPTRNKVITHTWNTFLHICNMYITLFSRFFLFYLIFMPKLPTQSAKYLFINSY